jgi:hypothetical protein
MNIDQILLRTSVRIRNTQSNNVIGSGVLYYNSTLQNNVYILTAAHCLYGEPETFTSPYETVVLELYSAKTHDYISITHKVNYNLVSAEEEKDIAILVIRHSDLPQELIDNIPNVNSIKERQSATEFLIRGFPLATKGEELDSINPTWKQEMSGGFRFQLNLKEDYTSYYMQGFSGSGVYVTLNNELYLLGVMTRFRTEEKGRVIYCQYLNQLNFILEQNFLPTIEYSFLGRHGLTKNFFTEHINTAIQGLGPRYDQELNFNLPIAKVFNDLSKDFLFRKRVLKCFQEWLSNQRNNYITDPIDTMKSLVLEIEQLKSQVIQDLEVTAWDIAHPINIHDLLKKIEDKDLEISEKLTELQRLQYEQEKDIDYEIRKSHTYVHPLKNEIEFLRKSHFANVDLARNILYININLADQPYLIIKGEAGSGKSHLLGDIANKRTSNDQPTILILGQSIHAGNSVWQNILSQLGLNCTQTELLESLNSIGQQKNCRVLVLIDAINEGDGKDIWPDEIAGFINQFKKYKYLGLVITIRTTYLELIPDSLLKDESPVTMIEHKGFSGHEYEALKLFCSHHHLHLPKFPILSPEFTRPLFLKLICSGLEEAGKKEFPAGFEGITSIYDFYIDSITKRFKKKRAEYRLLTNDIKIAISLFANASFKNNNRQLTIDEARQLFDDAFKKNQFFLADLIEEGVFLKNLTTNYSDNKKVETLNFSFERIGDYYVAELLVNSCTNQEEFISHCSKDAKLGQLLSDRFYWMNSGIIEALTILIPERFDIEIFEAYNWAFEDIADFETHQIAKSLNIHLLESLKWRSIKHIDDEKITNWLSGVSFNIAFENVLTPLLELTAQKEHPFNSDRFFRIMNRFKMPIRDSIWQKYLHYHNQYNDENIGYPIRRLIDWSWTSGISVEIDQESARLVGQTLAWVLSSTNIALRDQTTKAMVNLLEQQPIALIEVLKKYKKIDDPYIKERLFAVTYGCVMRCNNNDGIQIIAQYTFDEIFKKNNPPTHILIRDYTRNIIEFALYKKLKIKGNITRIKPPYNSRLPLMPDENEILKYKIDYKHPKYKKLNGYAFNQIHHSVMDWDFGRYTIKYALDKFYCVSFGIENEYKAFFKSLNRSQRQMVKLLVSASELMERLAHMDDFEKGRFITNLGSVDKFETFSDSIKSGFVMLISKLKEILDQEQFQFLENKAIPHFQSQSRQKDWKRNFFDIEPFKRWIVQRSFKLGYKVKLHADYESLLTSWNNREGNKIERIGKKYQWIALHEILGVVTDNYKLNDDSKKGKFYDFANELYIRNIDPVFTTKNTGRESLWFTPSDDSEELFHENWWLKQDYNYWNQPDELWVENIHDLPKIKNLLSPKDNKKANWYYLTLNAKWEQPKKIGEDSFDREVKKIDFRAQSYIIHKRNKNRLLKELSSENGKRFSYNFPSINGSNSIYTRENYWVSNTNKTAWKTIQGTSIRVLNPLSEAVGEMSEDKSDAHFNYLMPSVFLFDSLGLKYHSIEGNFTNENGDLIIQTVHPNGVLIEKTALFDFLNDYELDIIWIITGEKLSWKNYDESHFRDIFGVYSFDESNEIQGNINLCSRD